MAVDVDEANRPEPREPGLEVEQLVRRIFLGWIDLDRGEELLVERRRRGV